MKAFILLLAVLFYASPIHAQHNEISSAQITFEFPSKKVKGSIAGFESQSKINWEEPSKSLFKGSVDVATLDTNNGLRNWSLRSSRYFNAKTYSKISFASKRIQQEGNLWKVAGELTIKGITKPFDIEFEHMNNKLVGTGTLYSSDFDIKIKKNREDNVVKVKLELELVQ